jgi:hypothetical protein
LRVVDASVMPLVPAGHLQAVVYAVAEKVRSLPLSFSFSPFLHCLHVFPLCVDGTKRTKRTNAEPRRS